MGEPEGYRVRLELLLRLREALVEEIAQAEARHDKVISAREVLANGPEVLLLQIRAALAEGWRPPPLEEIAGSSPAAAPRPAPGAGLFPPRSPPGGPRGARPGPREGFLGISSMVGIESPPPPAPE